MALSRHLRNGRARAVVGLTSRRSICSSATRAAAKSMAAAHRSSSSLDVTDPKGPLRTKLTRWPIGQRTDAFEAATAAGQSNPGLALSFLRMSCVRPIAASHYEWDADGSAEWCLRVVSLLEQSGVDLRTARPFVWVLRHCAQSSAAAAPATILLELADAAGVPPSVQLYSALINVAAKQEGGADLGLALQTYALMLADGIEPNEVTFNSLLDAVARRPRTWKRHRQRRRRYDELWPPSHVLSVDTAGLAGSLLARMVQLHGLSPSVQTLTVLTTALSTADGGAAVSSGFGVVDLLRTAKHPLQPDIHFYNSLIQLCAKAEGGPDLQSALAVVDMMAVDGVAPDHPTFDRLFSICVRRHPSHGGPAVEAAVSLLPLMARHGLQPTVKSFNWLFEAQAIEAALRMRQRPDAGGWLWAANAFRNIQTAMGVRTDGGRVAPLDLLKQMVVEHGLQPTPTTFCWLLPAAVGHAALFQPGANERGLWSDSREHRRAVEVSWRIGIDWLTEFVDNGALSLGERNSNLQDKEFIPAAPDNEPLRSNQDRVQPNGWPSQALAGLASALAAQADAEQSARLLLHVLMQSNTGMSQHIETDVGENIHQGRPRGVLISHWEEGTAQARPTQPVKLAPWAWARIVESVAEACGRAAIKEFVHDTATSRAGAMPHLQKERIEDAAGLASRWLSGSGNASGTHRNTHLDLIVWSLTLRNQQGARWRARVEMDIGRSSSIRSGLSSWSSDSASHLTTAELQWLVLTAVYEPHSTQILPAIRFLEKVLESVDREGSTRPRSTEIRTPRPDKKVRATACWALKSLQLLATLRGRAGEIEMGESTAAEALHNPCASPDKLADLLDAVSDPSLTRLLLGLHRGQRGGTAKFQHWHRTRWPSMAVPEILHGAVQSPVRVCFDQLAGQHCPPPSSTTDASEAVFVRLTAGLAAFGLAKRLAAHGGTPGAHTHARHMDEAMAVIEMLRTQSRPVGLPVFNALLEGCARGAAQDQKLGDNVHANVAEQVYQMLEYHGLQPNAATIDAFNRAVAFRRDDNDFAAKDTDRSANATLASACAKSVDDLRRVSTRVADRYAQVDFVVE